MRETRKRSLSSAFGLYHSPSNDHGGCSLRPQGEHSPLVGYSCVLRWRPFANCKNMIFRRLGTSGLQVPVISLGGWLTYGGYMIKLRPAIARSEAEYCRRHGKG